MNLYEPPKQPDLIRVNIKCQNPFGIEHLALCQTNLEESLAWLKKFITDEEISNRIIEGHRTTIEVRESLAGENGKAKSFGIYTPFSPRQIKQFIETNLRKNKI